MDAPSPQIRWTQNWRLIPKFDLELEQSGIEISICLNSHANKYKNIEL